MITELFYSHVLDVNRGSFHTRSFRHVHLSVFICRVIEYGFMGPKSFRGFQETGPWAWSSRVLTTALLCCRWCLEWKFRYWSVLVGLWYTVTLVEQSLFTYRQVSRNRILLVFFSSKVNWMWLSALVLSFSWLQACSIAAIIFATGIFEGIMLSDHQLCGIDILMKQFYYHQNSWIHSELIFR